LDTETETTDSVSRTSSSASWSPASESTASEEGTIVLGDTRLRFRAGFTASALFNTKDATAGTVAFEEVVDPDAAIGSTSANVGGCTVLIGWALEDKDVEGEDITGSEDEEVSRFTAVREDLRVDVVFVVGGVGGGGMVVVTLDIDDSVGGSCIDRDDEESVDND
jgi:hypothetical protein